MGWCHCQCSPTADCECRVKESPHTTEIETAGVCSTACSSGLGTRVGCNPRVGASRGSCPAGPSGTGGPSPTLPRPRIPGTTRSSLRPGGPGRPPPRGRGWAGGGAVSRPPRGGRARPLPPWSQVQTAGPGAAGPGSPGPPQGPRPRGSMIFPRALSCAVLLLLLVAVLSRGRRCSIAKILRQYRAVIFHEIQNLRNLTGSVYRSGRAGPACRSDKDQKILLSIYNISMSLREVGAGTLQGPEELAVWRVARNTNFVLQENCRKISKNPPRTGPAPPRRGAAGRRRKQLRELGRKAERLATCWEKLNALHAPRQAPWDS
ncbi:uncharacterized protein LOC128796585 [Vidua chalybeata]|uniref:uncharacterized protein LOC128796585 n=1 Tax=Vidua chalybeata TaxID=81927 RepID=UPI0023A8C55B|nr:uncharacterized protein LOC128796585 [Vidua chalybeata]